MVFPAKSIWGIIRRSYYHTVGGIGTVAVLRTIQYDKCYETCIMVIYQLGVIVD